MVIKFQQTDVIQQIQKDVQIKKKNILQNKRKKIWIPLVLKKKLLDLKKCQQKK